MSRCSVCREDITRLKTEAIVNAANRTLLGGGGVDGAIHAAAGRGLLEECMKLDGCEFGECVLTGGHNLPARYVIHTVGPIWKGGKKDEEALLEASYRNSLNLAKKKGIKSIAFPCISTGAYAFPAERAAEIAVRTVRDHSFDGDVVFCVFSPEALEIYRKLGVQREVPEEYLPD